VASSVRYFHPSSPDDYCWSCGVPLSDEQRHTEVLRLLLSQNAPPMRERAELPKYLTPEEAMVILRISSKKAFYGRVSRGQIPVSRSGRKLLVPCDGLLRSLSEGRAPRRRFRR
jgi:hypothetical protein